MAVRFFKTPNGENLSKTGSGRGNPNIPGMPEEPGEWIEISSNEYYWRRQGLKKRKSAPKRKTHLDLAEDLAKQGLKKRKSAPKRKTHLDLAEDLAKQGPEAVHAYCLEHFGHGSGMRSTKLSESV